MVISVSLKEFQKIDPLTIHIRAVQSVHRRGMHITRLAQGPTRSRIAFHLCAPEKSLVIWCAACLILCCSFACRFPRDHHLPYSLFLLPRHKNTQHHRCNMINSESTQYITHPSSPSRQAAPSRTTMAGKPAEWREPAHDSSHRL